LLFLDSLFDAFKPFAAFFIILANPWFLYDPVREQTDDVAQSTPLCPLDRVEPEIVTQTRVGAGFYKQVNEVDVIEDYSEDECRLPAVVPLVDVSSSRERRVYSVDVAGGDRLSQMNGRTHAGAIISARSILRLQ
jgi:hypothetical protein